MSDIHASKNQYWEFGSSEGNIETNWKNYTKITEPINIPQDVYELWILILIFDISNILL